MKFNKICEFLNLAERCKSFPEFKMQAMLESHCEFTAREFYEDNVKHICSSPSHAMHKMTFDETGESSFQTELVNIDMQNLSRHIVNKFMHIPWKDDYLNAMDKLVSKSLEI